MDIFVYKATKNKKYVSDEIEGKDEDEVAAKLKEQGMEVLSVRKKDEKRQLLPDSAKKNISSRFQKIKTQDKVFLYKNFNTMLKAGLPLGEAIDLLKDSVKNKQLAEILGQLKYDVETGNYISASLARYPDVFKTNEIAMLQAGEVGGTLPESFEGLFEDANSEARLKKDIKGAMMYPAIIMTILLLVVVLLLVFVLPQLTGFFGQANIEVPTLTRIVMSFSAFLKNNFVTILVVGIVSTVTLVLSIKRSKAGKELFDKVIMRVPFLGKQFKYFFVHKFARMLSILIRSGVPILQALEIVEKSMTNAGYRNSIKSIREQVKRGSKLSDLIEKYKNLYPPFVPRMLKVGDRTGNTSEALKSISEYYQQELRETLDNLSTLIEPILMVVLGIGVAFIAITVLIPLYSIVSGINAVQK